MTVFREFNQSIFISWLIWSVVFSITGPFGTYLYLPFYWQLTFWVVLTSVIIVIMKLIEYLTLEFLNIKRDILFSMIIIVVTSAFIYLVITTVFDMIQLSAIVEERGSLTIFSYIAFCSAVILFTQKYTDKLWRALKTNSPTPRLFERLGKADIDLVSISAKDHRVEVTCPEGQQTLRIRFSDAVHETAPLKGYVIHRSHWIAENAIVDIFETQGRYMVRLKNDRELPISPAGQKVLTEAGVFEKFISIKKAYAS